MTERAVLAHAQYHEMNRWREAAAERRERRSLRCAGLEGWGREGGLRWRGYMSTDS